MIWLLVAFLHWPLCTIIHNPTSLNPLTISPLTGITSMILRSLFLFLLLGKPFLPIPLPYVPFFFFFFFSFFLFFLVFCSFSLAYRDS